MEAYHGILKKEVFNRVDYRTFGEIEIIIKPLSYLQVITSSLFADVIQT